MISEKTFIQGIAIRPGISRNDILYTAEELNKFAPTLIGRPILKDHDARTDNTIGLVETAGTNHIQEVANSGGGVVNYSGWLKEDGTGLIERIKDGRIKEVSIGAICGKLVKENDDDDFVKAVDIEAMELSTTPTPGCRGTSLNQSLESIEKHKKDEKVKILAVNEDTKTFSEATAETFIKENILKNNEEESTMTDEKTSEASVDVNKLREEIKQELKAEFKKEAEETKAVEEAAKKKEEELRKSIREKILKEAEDKAEDKPEDKPAEDKPAEDGAAEDKPAELEKKPDEGKPSEGETPPAEKFKGKIAMAIEKQREVQGDYVVERSEFGEGYALYRQPNVDGTYGGGE